MMKMKLTSYKSVDTLRFSFHKSFIGFGSSNPLVNFSIALRHRPHPDPHWLEEITTGPPFMSVETLGEGDAEGKHRRGNGGWDEGKVMVNVR